MKAMTTTRVDKKRKSETSTDDTFFKAKTNIERLYETSSSDISKTYASIIEGLKNSVQDLGVDTSRSTSNCIAKLTQTTARSRIHQTKLTSLDSELKSLKEKMKSFSESGDRLARFIHTTEKEFKKEVHQKGD